MLVSEQHLAFGMLGEPPMDTLVLGHWLAAAVQDCAAIEELLVACQADSAPIPEELTAIASTVLNAPTHKLEERMGSMADLVSKYWIGRRLENQ